MTSSGHTPSRTHRSGFVPWRSVWRQSRGDAAPLAVGMLVVASAAFLSAAVPMAVGVVATAEVQSALAAQGEPVAVVVTVPITDDGYYLNLYAASSAAEVRAQVDAGLPGELRGVLAPPVTALVGPEIKAGVIAGRPGMARFIYLSSTSGPAVDWVAGRAPASTGDSAGPGDDKPPPVELAISEAGATLMGVQAGDRLAMSSPDGRPLEVWLSGIYRATDPADDAWAVAPTLLKPQVVGGSAAIASVGLLASDQSLPFAQLAAFPTGMTRTYTYRVVSSTVDSTLAAEVATQARGLASGRKTFEIAGTSARVTTQLDRILDRSLKRIAAATAQSSVLLIGLLATAVLVELLAAGLVVGRRAAVLRQWRARGASQPAIALANAAESTALAAIAGLVGLTAAGLAVGGAPSWGWIIPPLIAAALPQPLLAMRAAVRPIGVRGRSGVRRGPLTPAQVRRFGAEGSLIVLALAGLATLVVRGVTASAGSVWSDGVVLAAPVLVALAVTLALVRVQPRVLGAARRVAARGRGAVALLAAARTRANGLAIAALVTASAIAAIAASVAGTVSQGQEEASWDAVGVDAAASTTEPAGLPAAVAALNGTGGLTLATATVISTGQVVSPPLDKPVTIVAVDAEALSGLLATTPAPDAPNLRRLSAREAGELPVLVTGGEEWADVMLRWGEDSVTIRSIGDAPSLPGQLAGGTLTVVVDRHLLAAAIGHDVPATQAWVVGPEAGTRLHEALAGTESRVVTRAGWLAEWAAAPVTRALGWLFVGASGVATALAALAVALMAASGAAERTRAGAQIRVLGTPRSAAARVAWLEAIIPAVLASGVGIATGIGLAGLLVVALDLPSVTGGLRVPRLVIPWWSVAIPVALGLVARIAVAVAGWRHTDEPLGPTMRAS